MISFNKPPYVGEEIKYIEEAVKAQKICGEIGRRRVGKECRSRWSPYH